MKIKLRRLISLGIRDNGRESIQYLAFNGKVYPTLAEAQQKSIEKFNTCVYKTRNKFPIFSEDHVVKMIKTCAMFKGGVQNKFLSKHKLITTTDRVTSNKDITSNNVKRALYEICSFTYSKEYFKAFHDKKPFKSNHKIKKHVYHRELPLQNIVPIIKDLKNTILDGTPLLLGYNIQILAEALVRLLCQGKISIGTFFHLYDKHIPVFFQNRFMLFDLEKRAADYYTNLMLGNNIVFEAYFLNPDTLKNLREHDPSKYYKYDASSTDSTKEAIFAEAMIDKGQDKDKRKSNSTSATYKASVKKVLSTNKSEVLPRVLAKQGSKDLVVIRNSYIVTVKTKVNGIMSYACTASSDDEAESKIHKYLSNVGIEVRRSKAELIIDEPKLIGGGGN